MKSVIVSQPRDVVRGVGAEHGSVAIVLRALADRLAARADLHVVAPSANGRTGVTTAAGGFALHTVPAGGRTRQKLADLALGILGTGLPMFARDSYFPAYAQAVAGEIGALRPDIVHLMTYPQLIGPIRAAAPGARLVLHLHDETLTRLPDELVARRLEPFSAIVTCSRWLAGALARRQPQLAERIHAIGNGVDVGQFRCGALVPEDYPKLLFVGRVSPEKGPQVLIDAFLRLADRWPDLRLVLAGPVGLIPYSFIRLIAADPPMRGALPFYGNGPVSRFMRQIVHGRTSFADALRARVPAAYADRVHFAGGMAHDRIPGLMGARTIFVQPSLCEEPFGLPLAEAMATGVPSIGSRRGGIPEIIDDGRSGRLVEAGDDEALARAIEAMLGDPPAAARMGVAGAEGIRKAFSWDDVAERLWRVWQNSPIV
ncbi:MAG: glycosyltransferase family 4 protein [Geminicoccaceae bacterium]